MRRLAKRIQNNFVSTKTGEPKRGDGYQNLIIHGSFYSKDFVLAHAIKVYGGGGGEITATFISDLRPPLHGGDQRNSRPGTSNADKGTSFETSTTDYPVMQYQIPVEGNSHPTAVMLAFFKDLMRFFFIFLIVHLGVILVGNQLGVILVGNQLDAQFLL